MYYHSTRFLRRSQALFERAEREAGDDAALLARLRHARFSLDRATLWLWDDSLGRRGRSGPGAEPLDRWVVLSRYTETALVEIERRIAEGRQETKWIWLEREVAKLRKRLAGEEGS